MNKHAVLCSALRLLNVEPNSLFHSTGQFSIEKVVAVIWRKINPVETGGERGRERERERGREGGREGGRR